MLATPWWPSQDLIGPGSLFPTILVCLSFIVATATKNRLVLAVAPFVLLIAAALTEGFPFLRGRRFPDADDFLGYYVLVAGAGLSAIELARIGSLRSLLEGEVVLFLCGFLLVSEALLRLQDLGLTVTTWTALRATALWMPLFAVVSWRVSLNYRMGWRIRHALCGRCGYDTRGALRCPECGESIILPRQQATRCLEASEKHVETGYGVTTQNGHLPV